VTLSHSPAAPCGAACIFFLWRRRTSKHRSRLLNSTSSTMSSSTNAAALLSYIEKWEIRCDDVKYTPDFSLVTCLWHMQQELGCMFLRLHRGTSTTRKSA